MELWRSRAGELDQDDRLEIKTILRPMTEKMIGIKINTLKCYNKQ